MNTDECKDQNRIGVHRCNRWLIFLVIFLVTPLRAQELPKGFKLLIDHGFQIQGMATKDDVFHLDTYKAANYTAINWLGESDVSKHGPLPGIPWSRWAHDK